MHHLILSLIISLFTLTAVAEEDTKRQAINLLMDKSGIERQINQIPNQMMQSLQQKSSQTNGSEPSIVFSTLADAAIDAYDLTAMKTEISDALYANLTDDDVIEILGWYASEVGQEITAAEIATTQASSNPAGASEIAAFMERLQMAPAAEERAALVSQLDNAVHGTDFLINTTLNTTVAFIKAMSKTMPTTKEVDISGQIEQQRAILKPLMAETVQKMFLYTYRDISDKDLINYVAFCTSPAGSKFYQSSIEALQNTLAKANAKMADNFAQKISEKAKSPVPSNPAYIEPEAIAK